MNRLGEPVIVFLGQPNCGKSTLFNAIAGPKAQTSNFPGTTVQHTHSQVLVRGRLLNVVDLPGTYSLTPADPAERTALTHLFGEASDLVVNVVDASILGRQPGADPGAARDGPAHDRGPEHVRPGGPQGSRSTPGAARAWAFRSSRPWPCRARAWASSSTRPSACLDAPVAAPAPRWSADVEAVIDGVVRQLPPRLSLPGQSALHRRPDDRERRLVLLGVPDRARARPGRGARAGPRCARDGPGPPGLRGRGRRAASPGPEDLRGDVPQVAAGAASAVRPARRRAPAPLARISRPGRRPVDLLSGRLQGGRPARSPVPRAVPRPAGAPRKPAGQPAPLSPGRGPVARDRRRCGHRPSLLYPPAGADGAARGRRLPGPGRLPARRLHAPHRPARQVGRPVHPGLRLQRAGHRRRPASWSRGATGC